jgi:hypothetical protein
MRFVKAVSNKFKAVFKPSAHTTGAQLAAEGVRCAADEFLAQHLLTTELWKAPS